MFLSRVVAFALAVLLVAVLVPKLGSTDRPDGAAMPADVAPSPRPAPAEPANPRRVALDADRSGHFLADVVINGRSVAMMVDTGATTVALSETTARRLGITPARADFTMPVSTANGLVMVAPVFLDEVKVGGISLRDVAATVAPGNTLGIDLLGMSFLGRLSRFEISGDRLVLYR